MKVTQLSEAVERETQASPAVARDRVDQMVHKILRALRKGQPVELPGLGRLVSDAVPKPDRRRSK